MEVGGYEWGACHIWPGKMVGDYGKSMAATLELHTQYRCLIMILGGTTCQLCKSQLRSSFSYQHAGIHL